MTPIEKAYSIKYIKYIPHAVEVIAVWTKVNVKPMRKDIRTIIE